MRHVITFAAGNVFGLAVAEDWGRVVLTKDVIGVGIYLGVGIATVAALEALMRRHVRQGGE